MKPKYAKSLFALLLTLLATAADGQTLFETQFDYASDFDAFTVEDANGDWQTWGYDDLFYAASCGRDYDADDWLISPQVSLVAGKTYLFTATVSMDQEGAETLSVMMGQSAQAAALTQTLIGPTEITSTAAQKLTATFKATATGSYFIGFHYATPDDGFSNRIYLNSVKLEETADEGVPAGVTALQVTPGAAGALEATVAFKAPALSITGGSLSSLTKIEVKRDGQLVKTFESPAVGGQLSFTDTGMANGLHTYAVVAYNEMGQGDAVEQEAYIGIDQIGELENVRFVYDYDTHKASLTWDTPTKGLHGGYVDTSAITYNVRRYYAKSALQTGISGNAFEDEVDIDYLHEVEQMLQQEYLEKGMNVTVKFVIDGQAMMVYYVQGVTPAGEGKETASNALIIGEPNELPYAESFAGGDYEHYWRTDIRDKRARWNVIADLRYSQDGDGGLLGFNAMEGEETAMCHTGNINMKEATTPVLTFYVYTPYANVNPLLVKVSKNDGDFETLTTIPLDDESQLNHFRMVSLPLTGCAGVERVKVGFEARMETTVDLVYIDNVRIFDQRMRDLSVELVSVPTIVKVGESKFMTVAVENLGLENVAMGAYTVNAYIDGQLAGTTMGLPVEAGAKVTNMLSVAPTIDMQEQSQLYVEAEYAADEMLSNNVTEPVDVKVRMPNLPEATNLKAAAGEGVVLSWDTPAPLRTADQTVTDGFETYEDFAVSGVGDWSLVDGDMGLVYGFKQYSYPVPGHIMSYIVFNPSQVENEEGGRGMSEADAALWQTYAGEKMLVSFSRQGPCDDWLISPELSGNAQTVSFYARHTKDGDVEYPEQFQVYFSTGGSEVTNFMAYDQSPVTTTFDWKKYEYVFPQGTKYFAIRKVSDDKWAFMLDDFTFAPDTLASQQGAIFYGYNVYKNGSLLNGALVSQPTFTDAQGKAGDTYRVTAVYNRGESRYSNAVVFGNGGATGIDNVTESLDCRTPAALYDLQGRRVSGLSGRGIVISSGRKLLVR